VNARIVARDALVRIEKGAYSHVVVPEMLRASSLSDRDRALVTDLVYGTQRSLRRLDALIEPHSHRSMRRLDAPVRAVLRVGTYELLRGAPAHAAVSEAVGAAPTRARGFTNAVMRSVAASGPPFPEPESTAVALSYPDWLVGRLERDLGVNDAHATLAAMNEAPTVTLRPNPRRTSPAELADELRADGCDVGVGTIVHDAVTVRRGGDPAALAAVRDGRATPQDQGSQAVIEYLAPEPGERVLDVASAPGGKATAVAERVGDDGSVVATDVNPNRLRLVRAAAVRLGLGNLATVVADGRCNPVRDAAFDRVLVDAPCSGLGVLRRRPDARWRVDEAWLPGLADLQVALVVAGARALRPGGMLVYAVCTLTNPETVGVAERVMAALPDCELLARPAAPWRPHGHGALLLPQDAGTDGMFVLGLRRAKR
jgi:16S rRNA (cytosine967-C5)-methyltransferase